MPRCGTKCNFLYLHPLRVNLHPCCFVLLHVSKHLINRMSFTSHSQVDGGCSKFSFKFITKKRVLALERCTTLPLPKLVYQLIFLSSVSLCNYELPSTRAKYVKSFNWFDTCHWCLAGVAASNEVFNALNAEKQLYLKTSGSFFILNLIGFHC